MMRQVEAGLALGHTYVAGLRLAALTSTYPDDLDIRSRRGQLAHQIGNFAEAGRWSYLGPVARARLTELIQVPGPMPTTPYRSWHLSRPQRTDG